MNRGSGCVYVNKDAVKWTTRFGIYQLAHGNSPRQKISVG